MRVTEKETGRKVVAINVRVDVEAFELLRELSPTTRARGHLLSRLLYEHRTRQEERARMKQQLAAVVGDDHADYTTTPRP